MGCIVGALPVLLVVLLGRTVAWRGFEERAEGVLRASAGSRPWHPSLVLVTVDEATLGAMRGTLDRAVLARVTEALTAAGVRAIALDFLVLREEPPPARGSEALARALEASGRVILPLSCELEGSGLPAPEELQTARLAATPTGTHVCRGATLARLPPHPGAQLAHVLLGPSSSGQARTVRLAVQVAGRAVPSLSLAAWMLGEGHVPEEVRATAEGLQVGGLTVLTDAHGAVLPQWRDLAAARIHSLGSLAEALGGQEPPRFPPALARAFSGAYVVMGFTAPEASDLAPLADGRLGPKLLVHASFLSDLLQGQTLEDLSATRQALAALLLGGLMIAAGLLLRPQVGALAVAVAIAAVLACCRALALQGLVVGPVEPLVAGLVGFGGALTGRLLVEGRERAVLAEAFGAYVDRGMLELLLRAPGGALDFEGQQRDVSVLFCDVSGYTGLSNALPAPQVIALVREYLAAMSQVITGHGGRVDKMMGDGIMSVFGDPLPLADHAARALTCARAMQARMAGLREDWCARGLPPLEIRIGVASGDVYVGNVGSAHSKLEYTVLGPTVNLASRLEGQAPRGGILVSDETRRRCVQAFDFVSVGDLHLKGYAEPQTAWQLTLGDAQGATGSDGRSAS